MFIKLNYSTLFIIFVLFILVACNAKPRNAFEHGTIKIAVTASTPPYSFYDPNDNKLVGFDIDIANEIARRLKKKLVIETYSINRIVYSVVGNQVDCGMESMYISAEREKVVDFSIPYNIDQTKLAVLDAYKNVNSVDDIKKQNLPISMRNGTVYPKILTEMGFKESQFLIYPDQTDLNIAIQTNNVVAIASTYRRLNYLKTHDNFKIKFVDPPIVTYQASGIIVNKKNPQILKKINRTLQDMIDDGTYHKIAIKWFGTDPLLEAKKFQQNILKQK